MLTVLAIKFPLPSSISALKLSLLESIFFGTLCGAMITGFYAIPSALVISFAQDAVSKKMAKEYIISTSEWKIIDQSVTN